jgi:hypothetical protein
VFWAGHAAWLARSLHDLEAAQARGLAEERPAAPGGIDLAIRYFPDVGLGRLEDGCVVAWVRGPRPAFDVHHGSPHGAGLLRVVRKADLVELVERCRLGGAQEAEWSGRAGPPSIRRGLRGGGRELRFSTWLARNHLRGGRALDALRAPLQVARRGLLAFAAPRVSSAFFLDPQVRVHGDGIELDGGLAWRGGAALAAARLRRGFQVDGEGLVVSEQLLAGGAARGLDYRVPAAASEVERASGTVRYRLA